jgi:hypothetical protein
VPKKTYNIKNKDEAMEFCNKLLNYASSKDFKPFSVDADFGKGASDSQREYYWAVIVEEQFNYFKNDILKFIEWLFLIVRGGLLDKDLIHQFNKILYNRGKSSERLTTDMREKYHAKIREDMLLRLGVNIPEPNINNKEE